MWPSTLRLRRASPSSRIFRDRVREINSARAVRRIRSRQHQFARQSERILVRALKHERPSVGHQRCVKAGRNLGREFHARFPRQPENHFRRGHGMGIDPVHMRKRTPADMMVDADQEPIFQPLEPGAVNAVTLQNDRRLVVAQHAAGLHNLIGERKRTVDARDAIVQHNIGMLAHRAQNLAAGQRRSDRIAVGTGVRGQHESLVLSDLPENILDAAMPFFHRVPCLSCFVFFARASNSSTRAFSCSARSSRKYNSGARLRCNRSTSSCRMYSCAASRPSRLWSASSSLAFDVDPDLRRPAIIRDMNRRHAHQPNPRIGQFAFDERFNLLAQSFANPPAMIFEPALLHDSGTSGKTHENIRKSGPSV